MISRITGEVRSVSEDALTLAVEPFEFEVLIPESARRKLQGLLGQRVTLHTLFYVESNSMASRLNPRLVGFLSALEREFFEVFCSVDGVGVRKALRAMGRPVAELARSIQDQDVGVLATCPGIGEALAERIVAKLRRKVGQFALPIPAIAASAGEPHGDANGAAAGAWLVAPEVLRDTFTALQSFGHSETQARQAIDRILSTKQKFATVTELIDAIYKQFPPKS